MRVSRQKAAENCQRIVEAAARLFRDEGFDGVGVDAIMKEAKLTHGGFYGHFASKDALMAEAMAHALDRSTAWQQRLGSLAELVAGYLSDRHRADRANGCAVAALGADVARQRPALRKAVTGGGAPAGRPHRLPAEARHAGRPPAARPRHLSGMVGALMLARAIDDPALAREILTAARQAFGKA